MTLATVPSSAGEFQCSDQGRVRGDGRDLARDLLGVVGVAAHQHEHGRRARGDEFASDIEVEVPVVQVRPEAPPGGFVGLRMVRCDGVRPPLEHLVEEFPVVVEADRLLQDGGRDPFGSGFHEPQAVGAADAAAEDMGALDAEMVEECEVIGGVGVPAVACGHRRA